MMAKALCLPASLYEVQDSKLYLPKTGSVVLALVGSGNSAELAVVTKGTDEAENDKPNNDRVSQNENVSERKVLIKNKLGHERLYPVQSLCPLSDPVDPLEWKPELSSSLIGLTGKWADMFLSTVSNENPFSWKTQKEIMTQNDDCQQIFLFFHENKFNLKNFPFRVILSIVCMFSSWNVVLPACTFCLCQVIIFQNSPSSVKSSHTSSTFPVLSVSVFETRMKVPMMSIISLSVFMVNRSNCMPVAEADASADAFFLVRPHPEELLASRFNSNVNYTVTNTFFTQFLYILIVQDVRFDSTDYHTDGAPTDYVYQSWIVRIPTYSNLL